MHGEVGQHVPVHGQIAHEHDVAGVKAHVSAHVQHFFHRNQAVVIEDIPIGRGHDPIRILAVRGAVGAYGQASFAIKKTRIAPRVGKLLQIDDFGQHLPGDHVLHIAQVVRVHGAVGPFGRGEPHMAEIGIKVVVQIIH